MANEKRLINANDLWQKTFICDEVAEVRKFIEQAPTVDAVEVVHGRWVFGYPVACSVCGGFAATEYEDGNVYQAWQSPYCPNCGAKMDGDGNG